MTAPWGGRRAQQVRALIAATLPQTCPRCGRPVIPGTPWDVGHAHDIDLYPELTWDPRNLRAEHRRCNRRSGAIHGNRVRSQRYPDISAISSEWDGTGPAPSISSTGRVVVIVCGPPGAGKTTFAQGTGLKVYDIDEPQWRGSEAAFRRAIRALATDPGARAAVIRSGARATSRARWAATTRATQVLTLTTPAAECRRRVVERSRPRPSLDRQLAAVGAWWTRHTGASRAGEVWTAAGW